MLSEHSQLVPPWFLNSSSERPTLEILRVAVSPLPATLDLSRLDLPAPSSPHSEATSGLSLPPLHNYDSDDLETSSTYPGDSSESSGEESPVTSQSDARYRHFLLE